MGVQAYADALLIIPKTLVRNGGFDVQDAIIALQVVFRIIPHLTCSILMQLNRKNKLKET